jgi:hypothetical protein
MEPKHFEQLATGLCLLQNESSLQPQPKYFNNATFFNDLLDAFVLQLFPAI